MQPCKSWSRAFGAILSFFSMLKSICSRSLHFNFALFKAYFSGLKILHKLPKEFRSPNIILTSGKIEELNVPNDIRDSYQKKIDELKKLFFRAPSMKFESLLIIMTSIRLMCLCLALYGFSTYVVILASMLQFVFAPYSFYVSFTLLLTYIPSFYIPMFLSNGLLRLICSIFKFEYYLLMNNTFIFCFFMLDICLSIRYTNQSSAKTPSHYWVHVFYGSLNCKSSTLLYFLLIRGTQFNACILLLDYVFRVTEKIHEFIQNKMPSFSWAVLFYHHHRIGHMPRVYEQAHKFHHYLHGTNSFDSHYYGCGFPEEWFYLNLHIVGSISMGWPPVDLNPFLFWMSMTNKQGHTQHETNEQGRNSHAYHHTYHTKNFGIYGVLMDMYFNTAVNNEESEWFNYRVKREVREKTVRLQFRYLGEKGNYFDKQS